MKFNNNIIIRCWHLNLSQLLPFIVHNIFVRYNYLGFKLTSLKTMPQIVNSFSIAAQLVQNLVLFF